MPYEPKPNRSCCVYLDEELRHKLLVIYTVRKRFFDKKTTISGIMNAALSEYLSNHTKEIENMMQEYYDNGGLLKL